MPTKKRTLNGEGVYETIEYELDDALGTEALQRCSGTVSTAYRVVIEGSLAGLWTDAIRQQIKSASMPFH